MSGGPPAGPHPADAALDFALWRDETVLWRGRPVTGLRLMKREFRLLVVLAPALVLMGGYALVTGAERGDMPGWGWWFFGFLVVLGLSLGPMVLWSGRERRRATRYALTDRRALAVCTFRMGFTKSWPVAEWGQIFTTREGRGLGSVVFHSCRIGRQLIEEGFDLIPDAAEVEKLMKSMQAGRR